MIRYLFLACSAIPTTERLDTRNVSAGSTVIRRGFAQFQFQKLAQRQRVRRPPRYAALALDPFEIANQQQAKISPRRQ
jgi:hypothetical protein